MLRLGLNKRAHTRPDLGGDRRETLFASLPLRRDQWPARGLIYSFLFHELVFFGLIFLSISSTLAERTNRFERSLVLTAEELRDVVYLPVLGGGDSERDVPEPEEQAGAEEALPAAPPATEGFSYPGPQPILSELQDLTNRIETLLQPALENPPILEPTMSLPNLVQIAEAEPEPFIAPALPPPVDPLELAARASASRMELSELMPPSNRLDAPRPEAKPLELPSNMQPPESPAAVQPEVEVPDPVLPVIEIESLKMESPELAAYREQVDNLMEDLSALAEVYTPADYRFRQIEAEVGAELEEIERAIQAEQQEILAQLESQRQRSAIEAAGKLADEARLEALVEELLALPVSGSDLKTLLALTPAPAPLDQLVTIPNGEARGSFAISPDPNLDTSTSEPGANVETSEPEAPRSLAEFMGAANRVSADNAASGGGTADGSPGPVAPRGREGTGGLGSGSGTGGGAGAEVFPGITILGGSYATGVVRSNNAANSSPETEASEALQTSYAMNIISTEDSGGGLPDFGVFSDEQIYTVFLDVRETAQDRAPSWTAEYAVLEGSSARGVAPNNSFGLVLPFPSSKQRPVLPPALVGKYADQMVIVSGIINGNGRLERMSVEESPNVLLNEPVLQALNKWTFRPAELDGNIVSIKFLLGIPLWLPE